MCGNNLNSLRLKSQIVRRYKTRTNEHHRATANSWVLDSSHHIHGYQRYSHNPSTRPVKFWPVDENFYLFFIFFLGGGGGWGGGEVLGPSRGGGTEGGKQKYFFRKKYCPPQILK